MAFRNEGTPSRDFGPHTQQKALLEARARFSEESWLNVSGLRLLQHSPHTTGRLRENSRNHLTIAITLPSVNRCRTESFLPYVFDTKPPGHNCRINNVFSCAWVV